MTDQLELWIRAETRSTERRAPVVPGDAGKLVGSGIRVTVERSPQRVFPIEDYQAVGCAVAEPGSWVHAPATAFVVGIKELPDQPAELVHRHIYFGHAYKGQLGAGALLERFTRGGGQLLDIEYLVDERGRRLAAFGYWAGYVGAALAVLWHGGRLDRPLRPYTRARLDTALRAPAAGAPPRVLVIGALGRSGRGACDALNTAGIEPTRWDVAETAELDRAALLDHDILVNTVLTTNPVPPFVSRPDVTDPGRRLSLISDVTADVNGEWNVLPIYERNTTWDDPVLLVHERPPLAVIGIDNLPSLLPREASEAFSAELGPQLAALGRGAPAWERCAERFRAVSSAGRPAAPA